MNTTTINTKNLEPSTLAWALRFEAGTAPGLSDAVELLVSDETFLAPPMFTYITVEAAGSDLSAWVDWDGAAAAINAAEVDLSPEIAAAWMMAAHLAADVAIDIDDTLRAMDLHACAIARDALSEYEQVQDNLSWWETAFAIGTPGREAREAWQLAGVIA